MISNVWAIGWCASAFVFVLKVSLVCTDAHAQPPDVTSTSKQNLRQGSAIVLSAVRESVLANAIAQENRPSPIGIAQISFPLPTCAFEGGLCGALNRDGSIAVPPQFDWIDRFHEDRALVRSAGLYGYVDTTGRVVVEPKYEVAGTYRRGVAEVTIDGKSALIDREGRQVLEAKFGRAFPFGPDAFVVNDGARKQFGIPGLAELAHYDALLATNSIPADGKWGLVDRVGGWIRRPEFSAIRVFDRNDDTLLMVKAATGWGVIRPDGTWHIEPKFEDLHPLSDGLAIAWIAGRLDLSIKPVFGSLPAISTISCISSRMDWRRRGSADGMA